MCILCVHLLSLETPYYSLDDVVLTEQLVELELELTENIILLHI